MKLWVFSDLHLDVNAAYPFDLPIPRPEHDVVVIAGDICEDTARAIGWIAEVGLNARPVVFVAGNHEFYGHDRRTGFAEGRAAAHAAGNIHLLECDAVVIGDVTFLGATLWSDYALGGAPAAAMSLAERMMSDHRLIRLGARAWTAADAADEHALSIAWLTRELARPSPGPVCVVTHHAPSARSISERFRTHPLNAAFASDLDDLVAKADLWVHGHTHSAARYRLGRCEVVNNPRGYLRREQTGFDPGLVIDVGAAQFLPR